MIRPKDVYKRQEHEVFSKEIAVTIPADNLNGTFAYSAEKPEDQGKLTYDVTSIEKRKEGLDLKTALVWKDATACLLYTSRCV